MENLSGQHIKGYELRERIGAGGFGAVYRANQSTVGREVAVKIILPHFASHPDFIRRFETEAQLVARLEHLHIVPLYDYWRDPDGAYLVMRWLKGGSLRDALNNGPFTPEASALLLDQVASALAAAHRSDVIHRDLKPGNILLDEDGNAYLADFGIAKDVGGTSSVTEPDAIVGSPDYLAPEQARAEQVTPRTDIYSLGVVLYEVLTGQHPFPNLNMVERLYKHLNEPLPEIDALPDDVRQPVNEVIQKATAKNPQNRYADTQELADAFRAAIKSSNGNPVETLTLREQEILRHIIDGRSNKEIAQQLVITVMTVKWYITHIYRKLGVRSRVQAIVRARELNLIAKPGTFIEAPSIPTDQFQPENPYKGLRAFQSADHLDFFGREKLVEKLLKRMTEKAEGSHFLAVVGPSGSGKSSLVKAGLVPALWRGELPGSEKWFVAEMLPSAHPLDELEVALTRIATNQAVNFREQLERDERGLQRAAQLILPDDGSELLLVIDQFEEVFTLVEDESERIHFLNILENAVSASRSRVRVVITLRADFYDRPLHYPQLGELVRNRMETVLPLSAEGLERAIARPAERVGVRFEPGLVATIISEINYQAGALPLLQYALTELFEHRQGRQLTQEAYQAIGRTTGALAKRAEELYRDLTLQAQETAQQMFLRLVTLGEGVEDTRRRTTRSELLSIANDPEIMDEIIDTYAEYRLLSLDHDPGTRTPTVEVAHEAILREWERLRNWLNDSREDIRLQRQLASISAEWQAGEQDPSFLLRGSRLETYEKWMGETKLALTPIERTFLQTSLETRVKEQTAEQEQQARVATLERRSVRFLRILAAVLLVATIGALGLTAVAVNQSNLTQQALATSDANFTRAEAERLSAEASKLQLESGNSRVVALLAIRSLNTTYTEQGDLVLNKAVSLAYPKQAIELHNGMILSLAFSPDGRYVLYPDGGNSARLWDVQENKQVQQFVGHTDFVTSVAYSPDGKYILTGSLDKTARLWDANTGEIIKSFVGHTDAVQSVTFSPQGTEIATASDDHTIRLWNIETGLEIGQFDNGNLAKVVFSPDGQYLLTGSDFVVTMRSIQTQSVVQRFNGHTASINNATFSPDGRTVLTSSNDGTVRLWDSTTSKEIRRIGGLFTQPIAIFSSDGRSILIAESNRIASLWDVATGQEKRYFTGHTSFLLAAAFSQDDSLLATASLDGVVLLWNVQDYIGQPHFEGDDGQIWDLDYSPNGQYIVTGATNGTTLWNAQTGQQVRTLLGSNTVVTFTAFSGDNRYIATAKADGTAQIWDAQTGKQIREFSHPDSLNGGIAFSPDGRYLLVGCRDNLVYLWDIQTGKQVHVFSGHTDDVYDVAYSPDGRYVASGAFDKTVRLWDVATGLQVWVSKTTDGVASLTFSPDGNTIAAGLVSGSAILLETQTGAEIRRFIGHTDVIWSIAFSPDGYSLATGSQDTTARLWDVQSSRQLRVFGGHTNSVEGVTFSPDGHFLVTGSTDTTVHVWDVDYHTTIYNLCLRLLSDFTPDERQQYDLIGDTPTCPQFATTIPSS